MSNLKKKVCVGRVTIGGGNPVSVQSMLKVDPLDIKGNVKQAIDLQNAGCDIIRVAVPDKGTLNLISSLKDSVDMPVVADIHFDYKLAIESIKAGADKIRINPGNIGDRNKVELVAKACKEKNIPIRVGVNSGSLEKNILAKYGRPTSEALCESAMYHVSILEDIGFNDIVISMKSSDVKTMINAYRLMHKKCNYPLHLGVTESGTIKTGIVKSACGIGALLADGIGDTIRFSLTADPIKEVTTAIELLKVLHLRKCGIEIISCPTCGRTKIDLFKIASEAEEKLSNVKKNIKVAIMGCAVNGPGEAKEADLGIAGGDGVGVIFRKGKIIKKVSEDDLLSELICEIKKI